MYTGPGLYRHWKGGRYLVFGLVRLEHNNTVHVLYTTLSEQHREDAFHKGMIGTVRPLNDEDGPDAFNTGSSRFEMISH